MSDWQAIETSAKTWLSDTRQQFLVKITMTDESIFSVKGTPDRPGGNRFILTCLELPGWEGRCAYDDAAHVAFQFSMQARDAIRDAPSPSPIAKPPQPQ